MSRKFQAASPAILFSVCTKIQRKIYGLEILMGVYVGLTERKIIFIVLKMTQMIPRPSKVTLCAPSVKPPMELSISGAKREDLVTSKRAIQFLTISPLPTLQFQRFRMKEIQVGLATLPSST